MALLSTLAAHDLGFIRTPELVERLEATLSTMDGLERFEGHLLNWYDTRTLAPLPPRYVSTVDSGNLAGALLALAEGLRRLAGEPQSATQICAGQPRACGGWPASPSPRRRSAPAWRTPQRWPGSPWRVWRTRQAGTRTGGPAWPLR